MASSKPLPDLLLANPTTTANHEEILLACKSSSSSSDLKTQHIRVVALLKLDRYADALGVLDTAGLALRERARLEWAYALYKSGELEAAREVARDVAGGGGRERGARHVEAQASYRSEDFANAAEIYRELQQMDGVGVVGDEESDLRINAGATDVQLEWKRQGGLVTRKSHGREDLEAFETAYNAACGSIARGELVKGEFLLNTAKGLCASLDELTEAERTAEILPIQVQQLYVLGKLGKTAEAEKLASEITVQDIPDASTRQIAQNNLLASTSSTNTYLSHRLMHDFPPLPKTDTLFAHQASLIEQNTLALDLLASKSSAVQNQTARTLSNSPSPTINPHTNALSVLNAAAHAQSQLAKLGLKSILPLFVQRPTDIGLAMTIIQLYMLTSNPGAATTVLESLLKNISSSGTSNDDILFAPGLVALQVSLYSTQNRRSTVTAVLAKAASYWRHKSKSDSRPTTLLQAAGLELLTSQKPKHQTEALAIFTSLRESSPDDKFATAGFIAASALAPNPNLTSLTESANQALPPVARLIHGLDIDALEAAGVPSLPSGMAGASSSSGKELKKRKAEVEAKPKKKRVRLSKRPKDFVEGKKMDEERWLPLRERSSYRPKGKKGRKKMTEQTQGGPAEKVGGDGKKADSGVAAATAAGVVTAPSGGGGSGGGGKAKGKKKGKN